MKVSTESASPLLLQELSFSSSKVQQPVLVVWNVIQHCKGPCLLNLYSNYFLTTLLNQLLLLVCKFLVLSPSRPASIAFRSLINSKFSALSGSLDRVALLLGVLDAGPRDGTAPCLCGRTKQQNPAIANIYWDKNTRASWPRTASLPSANGIIPIGDTR